MGFATIATKGLDGLLLDTNLAGKELKVHISEVAAGERSHPPHQHGGTEAIYMFEGEATLEIGESVQVVQANQAIVFDPNVPHGLRNSGDGPMRYMVIIANNE
jgi:(S)-ureidoglycine aminohydrolase